MYIYLTKCITISFRFISTGTSLSVKTTNTNYNETWRIENVVCELFQHIIIFIENKDRQYNGQKKKDNRMNNDLHNTTQKTIDRAT